MFWDKSLKNRLLTDSNLNFSDGSFFSFPIFNRFIIKLFTDGGYTQWTEFSPCTAKCADERGDRVRFVNLTFERKHFLVFTLLMRFNYYIPIQGFEGTFNNCLTN